MSRLGRLVARQCRALGVRPPDSHRWRRMTTAERIALCVRLLAREQIERGTSGLWSSGEGERR